MLSPEEIEEIRQQELARLEQEAQKRDERVYPQGSTPRMEDKDGERLAREREARQLRKAIEEEFWSSRGYQRYVTHSGKELWLTADEIRERRGRRRSRMANKGKRPAESLWQDSRVQRILLYLAVLILGVVLGLQLV